MSGADVCWDAIGQRHPTVKCMQASNLGRTELLVTGFVPPCAPPCTPAVRWDDATGCCPEGEVCSFQLRPVSNAGTPATFSCC